jgi:uncharacterized membrane protein
MAGCYVAADQGTTTRGTADVIHLLAVNIFNRQPGLEFLARWAHVVVGIAWIGLLFYFNFVQVPSFAKFDAATRNEAIDKLASRALWWFRWASVFTVLTGLLILLAETDAKKNADLFSSTYWKTAEGTSIATGILIALVMFLNVWGIIWRNQKVVIANARNVLAGGEANPAAADAGRRAALASRQNTLFAFPMLLFMVGTPNFFNHYGNAFGNLSNKGVYWIIVVVIVALFEANALGLLGGRAVGNPLLWMYENHWRTIAAGIVLSAVFYAVWEIVF